MQNDRKDESAVGWDHVEKVDKHDSQKGKNQITTCVVSYSACFSPLLLSNALDYKTGFGGKFGVQNDRMDKSSVGWDHVEKVEKHVSQKGKLGL